MRKDIEHFAAAVRAQGLDPEVLRRRALAGVDGLVEAVTLATAPGHAACPPPSDAHRAGTPNFHSNAVSRKKSDHGSHHDPLRLLLHR
jgi:hypothetical protein